MLKPLLLLCWILAIVSADTTVLPSSADEHVTANTSGTTKLPVLVNINDVPQDPSAVKNQSNVESTKSSSSTPPTTNAATPPTTERTTTQSTTTQSTSTTASSTTTLTPTTPAPVTPLPPPSTGKWMIKDKNNTVCIIVQMAAQFNISYTSGNVTISKAMDVPSNSTQTGDCGKTEQTLTLSWQSHNNSSNQNNFALHFVKNETDKHYFLHHFEISLAPQEFPSNRTNKTVTVVHVAPQFSTGLSNSYRCFKEQSLNLTLPNGNATVGHIKVSNLQFQAFRGDNTTVFGLAKDCSFDTPDIVPITVGCALAALVFIVLVAYLFGRRRSQTRGYLSM